MPGSQNNVSNSCLNSQYYTHYIDHEISYLSEVLWLQGQGMDLGPKILMVLLWNRLENSQVIFGNLDSSRMNITHAVDLEKVET